MANDVEVRMDQRAINSLADEPGVRRYVLEAGRGLAERARGDAPRNTGAGGDSIHAEPAERNRVAYVSWDPQHYYMVFQESGWEQVPGRHFLQRAYESYIHY